MNSKKSFLIRLTTNVVLIITSITTILYLWDNIEKIDTSYFLGPRFCMILSFMLVYVMIYSIVYAHTMTQKETEEIEGDFMCDC